MDDALKSLLDLFRSPDPTAVTWAVSEAEKRYPGLPGPDRRSLLEALLQLFYLDLYDRPEMAPVQERAMAAVARLCHDPECLAFLLEHLAYPDLKASLTVARVLGAVGRPAVGPVGEFYRAQSDPYARAMALHAMSKVHDPGVLDERDLVLEALRDGHQEIRDTAARTVGKFCQYFNPGQVPPDWIRRAFATLMEALADPAPPVRAKALRSLGKMVRGGFLGSEEARQVEHACHKALGHGDFNWDFAYIVRVEAEEVLKNVAGRQ
jgi:HEAT repeat protein